MQRLNLLLAAMLLLVCSACPSKVFAMGEEAFGNHPKSGSNYDSWPGILPVINDKHRVYAWWVNGNEKFFFAGDTLALNDALAKFAQIKLPELEVILRAAPGKTKTFDTKKSVDFDWELHVVGGIAGAMRREHLGDRIWVNHPVLSIYIGDRIKLDELKIPDSVRVSQLADLQRRYAEALDSTSKTVRGWACGNIASLDPYNSAAMYRIAKVLTGEDNWIKLNAAGALKSFGAKAKPALKQLQAAAESDDPQLRKRAADTIQAIEAAEVDEEAEAKHVATVTAIAGFIRARSTK